eukprot:CAMPEP_0201282414 /NCGR_PEP_ID=MMETSP1317-20130820/5601_1 /ASSEMBLY_ACC=CAM_ASM_000770 /TAXON_ID=187299 /ORGANISM="Undescribed Undescribed, Strain Undescribed" /LENGTH=94 /DNA_ID=CAMNT_0047595013 /DNA_START=565 /DNA_END=846 /DNA_ORIENTATION=-
MNPPMRSPVISVALDHYVDPKTNADYQATIEEDEKLKEVNSRECPNFLQYATFKNLMLPKDLLYLPTLKIKVEDKSLFGSRVFALQPLVNYADW